MEYLTKEEMQKKITSRRGDEFSESVESFSLYCVKNGLKFYRAEHIRHTWHDGAMGPCSSKKSVIGKVYIGLPFKRTASPIPNMKLNEMIQKADALVYVNPGELEGPVYDQL